MRPHRLTISGFLAYGDTAVVDFDALSEGGLFLIHGETGAGKTTILDAMAFAIYGKLPGAREGHNRNLRSHHAAADVPTRVTLEATARGERLRITRNPEYERPKKHGREGVTREKAAITVERWQAGEWELIGSRLDEMGGYLREWIGLDDAQFFKLVLLPQGDFAQFLRASGNERAAVLRELFADELATLGGVERWFREQLGAARTAVENTAADVAAGTRVLRSIAEPFLPEAAAADVEVTSDVLEGWAEQLQAQAQERAIAVGAGRDAVERAQQELATAEAQVRATEQYQRALATLAAQERALADWQQHIDGAVPPETLITQLRSALAALDISLGRASERAQQAQELRRLRAERVQGVHAVSLLDSQEAELQQAIASRATQRDAAVGIDAEIHALEVAAPTLAALAAEARRTAELVRDRDAAAVTSAQARTAHEQAAAAATAGAADVARARESVLHAQAGELALLLVAGEPCPVCGSAEHPAPAATAEAAAQRRRDWEQAEAALVGLRETEAARAGAAAAATATLELLDAQLGEQRALTAEAAQAQAQQAAADVTANGAALAVAREALDAVAAAIRQDTEDEQRLSEVRAERAQVIERVGAWDSEIARLEGVLGLASGAEPAADDLESLQQRASTLAQQIETGDQQLAAHRAALVALEQLEVAPPEGLPDLEGLRADLARLRGQVEAATREHARVEHAAAAYATALATTVRQRGLWERAGARFEQLQRIGAFVTGEAGRPRVRLTEYYLGARLEQVLAHANVRLDRMSGGRFQFRHAPDAGGAGYNYLSVHVQDAWTGAVGPVAMLSGGETFTASLALALGLADIVEAEAGGRTLEALFVDEGFGSLSADYLANVMDGLDSLRSGGRFVGLISHVDAMKQRIPMQLEVLRTARGSRLAETVV